MVGIVGFEAPPMPVSFVCFSLNLFTRPDIEQFGCEEVYNLVSDESKNADLQSFPPEMKEMVMIQHLSKVGRLIETVGRSTLRQQAGLGISFLRHFNVILTFF